MVAYSAKDQDDSMIRRIIALGVFLLQLLSILSSACDASASTAGSLASWYSRYPSQRQDKIRKKHINDHVNPSSLYIATPSSLYVVVYATICTPHSRVT